jgi:hypothetical protein
MTLVERLHTIVQAMPPGSTVMLPVDALREWLDEAGALAFSSDDFPVEEVAAKYGRAVSTVRNWCAQGVLPGAYKVNGKEWMIPRSALAAFKDPRTVPPKKKEELILSGGYDMGAWRKKR